MLVDVGFVRTYIVLPTLIYGIAAPTNPLVSSQIMHEQSVAVPSLIKAALDRGRPGMIGKGLSYWSNVHIDDQADFFIILFDAIIAGSENVGHGIGGFYYLENGEHSAIDLARALGRAMVELGLCKPEESEPTTLSDEEQIKYFGSIVSIHMASCSKQ